MKKIIFSIALIGILMSMNISYAIMAPPGYGLRYVLNSAMSVIIGVIIVFFLIKLLKAEDRKRVFVKFINILSIAIILKLSSWFLAYIIVVPFLFFASLLGGF